MTGQMNQARLFYRNWVLVIKGGEFINCNCESDTTERTERWAKELCNCKNCLTLMFVYIVTALSIDCNYVLLTGEAKAPLLFMGHIFQRMCYLLCFLSPLVFRFYLTFPWKVFIPITKGSNEKFGVFWVFVFVFFNINMSPFEADLEANRFLFTFSKDEAKTKQKTYYKYVTLLYPVFYDNRSLK